MTQDQESVDYRSIMTALLKNPEDLDLVLQISKKLLATQKPSIQLQAPEKNGNEPKSDVTSLQFFPGQFFGKSQMQAAAEILRGFGKPQKTKTIMDAMAKAELKVGGKDPEGTIYRSLLRSKEFMKVAPDTWGLAEWYPEAKLKPPTPTPMRGRKRRGRPPKRKAMAEVPKRTPIREGQMEKSEA